ncbi:GAF domain-containing protein [Paenibacillus sp. WQ 127069]|uniref:GAF domain-containing protein n=1 Tax=Paenibacillus baimaensis TaxID=2982185 RepID=A0ABT2UJV8_9BACL|nr:GAF domain-containing protein [Paenibacillus sp. WQ 127069]MCU6794172.1 GAF domain-containing protein [Paenibacillus sp. WQ 127069]
MFQPKHYEGSPEERYTLLLRQLDALIEDEPDLIANLANASALLGQFLETINWVGFYLLNDDNTLVLGPFQGLPACTRITYGKGVCGTAVAHKRTQRVDDVHLFPGHIACDAASRSELVIPLFRHNTLIGVLDIDSPVEARFTETDQYFLEQFCQRLTADFATERQEAAE